MNSQAPSAPETFTANYKTYWGDIYPLPGVESSNSSLQTKSNIKLGECLPLTESESDPGEPMHISARLMLLGDPTTWCLCAEQEMARNSPMIKYFGKRGSGDDWLWQQHQLQWWWGSLLWVREGWPYHYGWNMKEALLIVAQMAEVSRTSGHPIYCLAKEKMSEKAPGR